MDTKGFKSAVELLTKEKGIKEEIVYEALELALTSAYKKNYKSLSNVRVEIDKETGEIKVFSYKTVVDPESEVEIVVDETFDGEDIIEKMKLPFDERIHLTLEQARVIVPKIELGETIEEEVTPKDFGRVAAATAKQVVIQKIREAERNIINEEYGDKQDEMISGIVAMEDVRNYYIDFGKIQGILPKTETIPGEEIKMGSNIKVYVTKVETNSKGTVILLSRNHYGFVKRLFELEIPEIEEGIILVYSVAREAGNRTKVAVYSENSKVDAIGSCIGEKGSRINRIIEELNGEKIDVILYEKDAVKFISNALSPAKDVRVFITDETNKNAMVVVNDENLPLAIGKKGANVRLAARLTHYRIDIKTYEQAAEEGINIIE
ncbi:MAG: transcription termination factor NusA [Bacilli bacterium]|nr:transcription termination factor NusA [Bacilli bacterium]MDD4718306.1 transcription termination factor NusA [Bacilli bacterium]